MADVVFMLGAGASAAAGVPTMRRFIDHAEDLWRRSGRPSGGHAELVFDALAALQAVHSKCNLDITNLESVFSALEMATLLSQLAGLKDEEIGRLAPAMRRLIVETVEESLEIPVSENAILPPAGYRDLVILAEDLREQGRSVAFMTFNYDVALDVSLALRSIDVDYGLKAPTGRDTVPLLKLHGSTNWARCDQCREIQAVDMRSYLGAIWGRIHPYSRFLKVACAPHFSTMSCCMEPVDQLAVIVPPTWAKAEHQRGVQSVWRRAASELREASYIFCIGYSLPENDLFFRDLFAVGTAGDRRLRCFGVIDPDGQVAKRYRLLLGPGAIQRFQHSPATFVECTGPTGPLKQWLQH